MIGKKMEAAINEQIKWEFYSGYMYLSMAAYFDGLGLAGFASWMRVQELEERFHAQKFMAQLVERGGTVKLAPIDGPPTGWMSPLAVFEDGLKHERGVTGRIGALLELAQKEKDHAAVIFIEWFVTEQVEEEASFAGVIAQLKLIDKTPGGLFMLDKDLAARTFNPTGA
ncbi:MAG: ferritin [Desulfovibrionaceae bacterium]|nr:ferritin [Desulfovibrionaceae bacterium]MBF0514902.1 ferritin [Desulfovibrionaceae bacterium]